MEKRRIIMAAGIILFLSAAVTLTDYRDARDISQNGLPRAETGGTDQTETVWFRVDGRERRSVSLDVSPTELSEKETDALLKKAREEWEESYLGKNPSADRVSSDLVLPASLQDGMVQVDYAPDDMSMLSETGELQPENIPEDGAIVRLQTTFSCASGELTDIRSIHLYRPDASDPDGFARLVQQAAVEAEQNSREKQRVVLPQKVAGHSITWEPEKTHGGLLILLLGAAALAALHLRTKEEARRQSKERKEQLLSEYPQMIDQFCMLTGSGMTIRKAWEQMVRTYRRQIEKDESKHKLSMEEMTLTAREMQEGRSERDCYERFGERVGLEPYRRFAVILSRNLRRGTNDLNRILREEAEKAVEIRKNTAKRLGEEASTKLLGPMLLMFLIILAAVLYPALVNL